MDARMGPRVGATPPFDSSPSLSAARAERTWIQGLEFRVQGLGVRGQGLGVWVKVLGV